MKRSLPFLLGLSLIGSAAFANEPAPSHDPATEKLVAKKPVKKTQKVEKKDPAK